MVVRCNGNLFRLKNTRSNTTTAERRNERGRQWSGTGVLECGSGQSKWIAPYAPRFSTRTTSGEAEAYESAFGGQPTSCLEVIRTSTGSKNAAGLRTSKAAICTKSAATCMCIQYIQATHGNNRGYDRSSGHCSSSIPERVLIACL